MAFSLAASIDRCRLLSFSELSHGGKLSGNGVPSFQKNEAVASSRRGIRVWEGRETERERKRRGGRKRREVRGSLELREPYLRVSEESEMGFLEKTQLGNVANIDMGDGFSCIERGFKLARFQPLLECCSEQVLALQEDAKESAFVRLSVEREMEEGEGEEGERQRSSDKHPQDDAHLPFFSKGRAAEDEEKAVEGGAEKEEEGAETLRRSLESETLKDQSFSFCFQSSSLSESSEFSAALQSSPPPRQKQESEQQDNYYVNVGYAIRTLREELPSMFYKELTYDIYRDDITFRDPLNSFSGIDNYKLIFWALRFHGRIFFRALWVDVVRVWQPSDKVITVRWSVRGLPRVPWEAQGHFDGTSEYKLDKEGKIYEHRVDNVVMNTPQRLQPLTVMELVRLAGARTTPTPTFYERAVLFLGLVLPYISTFTWVRFYWALTGTLALTETFAIAALCG